MRDKMTYELSWKNEDTNRVSSKKFTNERGKDHSAFDAACEMAQVLDGNMWPWIIERDGEEILHGCRFQPIVTDHIPLQIISIRFFRFMA